MFAKLDNDRWNIYRVVVGDLMVNCYIVFAHGSHDAAVIDPGGDAPVILDVIRTHKLNVVAIINTHGHGDHIGADDALRDATGAPLMISAKDAPMLGDPQLNISSDYGVPIHCRPADRLLAEGDKIRIGDGEITVLETPGHTTGSITLAGDGWAAVGDLLFAESVGRTDFPGGDFDVLIKSIHEKIYPLGDDCVILPGHEDWTTVGRERETNPFLLHGNLRGW